MSAAKDPLDGLADSLDAEEEAVGRRFREADASPAPVGADADTRSASDRSGGLRALDAMTPVEFGETVEQSEPLKPGRKPSS